MSSSAEASADEESNKVVTGERADAVETGGGGRFVRQRMYGRQVGAGAAQKAEVRLAADANDHKAKVDRRFALRGLHLGNAVVDRHDR